MIPVSYSPVGYVSLRAEVLTCLLYTTLYQIHWVGAQVGSIILLKMVFPNTALISVLLLLKRREKNQLTTILRETSLLLMLPLNETHAYC